MSLTRAAAFPSVIGGARLGIHDHRLPVPTSALRGAVVAKEGSNFACSGFGQHPKCFNLSGNRVPPTHYRTVLRYDELCFGHERSGKRHSQEKAEQGNEHISNTHHVGGFGLDHDYARHVVMGKRIEPVVVKIVVERDQRVPIPLAMCVMKPVGLPAVTLLVGAGRPQSLFPIR
jgi:hypothetical protein